jgi:hypothetical protein
MWIVTTCIYSLSLLLQFSSLYSHKIESQTQGVSQKTGIQYHSLKPNETRNILLGIYWVQQFFHVRTCMLCPFIFPFIFRLPALSLMSLPYHHWSRILQWHNWLLKSGVYISLLQYMQLFDRMTSFSVLVTPVSTFINFWRKRTSHIKLSHQYWYSEDSTTSVHRWKNLKEYMNREFLFISSRSFS